MTIIILYLVYTEVSTVVSFSEGADLQQHVLVPASGIG